MTEHPLTNDILHRDFNGYHDPGKAAGYSIYDADDMRSVADWQLEEVMKWLDESLSHYGLSSMHKLKYDLKEAMRPTTQENN